METKGLRFAPLIRVSTEKQENKGESLLTQRTRIIEYVKILGGTIPDESWLYSGQEHATPGQERQRMDKLLKDSSREIFDAVIVVDASRWSRDNLKSKEGLNILKENGIRFFVGTTEYDLFSPAAGLYLGMSAEIGEFQAREQARKSIESRIHRAQRGIPSTGKVPFGRSWDKKTGKWIVDEEKRKMIQQAAARYLDHDKPESMPAIAATLGMNHSNLWKILTQRSGSTWIVHFDDPKVNVQADVEMPIEPLLDDDTIAAIHEKARANKTYSRGDKLKHHYLLSRMIFCKECGTAMFGFTNVHGMRYYRHNNSSQYYHRHGKHRDCHFKKFLLADDIEFAVLLQLMQTLGDSERIRKAVQNGTPDLEKVKGLNEEKGTLNVELKRVESQINTVVEKTAKGLFTDEQIRPMMDKLNERQRQISNRLSVIENTIASMPDPERIRKLSKLAAKVISDATRHNPNNILKETYEYRRRFIESAFAGVDEEGNRYGVYMSQGDNLTQWLFEIRGAFENSLLTLPLSDDFLIEAFGLDAEYQDVNVELTKIKTNFAWRCKAEYPPGSRFHAGIPQLCP